MLLCVVTVVVNKVPSTSLNESFCTTKIKAVCTTIGNNHIYLRTQYWAPENDSNVFMFLWLFHSRLLKMRCWELTKHYYCKIRAPTRVYYSPCQSQSQSHITTDVQSISKSWRRAPSDIYYSLTVTVLFLWGALSDERAGLSFVYADGPCQQSLSQVWVPWDS
jgi:hypothetical protein